MKRVFVHGLGQAPSAWEETISRLEGGEACVCPDLAEILRGRAADYQSLYAGFSALCESLDGPLDLCGLSLGGVLALNYAADYPEKARSLVLIAAPYRMPKGLLKFQNAVFRLMPKAMFRGTGMGKEDMIRLCASMRDLDLSGLPQRAACPALVLCGERDRANRKASAELAGLLKNAELQTLAGAGHEVNAEAPETLADALRAFYRRLE